MKLQNLSAEDYAALCATVLQMKEDGTSMARIGAELGLSHTQVDAITYRARITQADRDAWEASGPDLGARAAAGREQGLSWGWIGYVANVPESQVRAAFAKATANKSQGQRIGKGGRFYYRDGVLYEDVLKPTGTVIPVGTDHAGAVAVSRSQRFERLGLEGQERIAEQIGLAWVKGSGKSRTAWMREVCAVLEGKEPAPKRARTPKAPKVQAPVAEPTTTEPELPEVEADAS